MLRYAVKRILLSIPTLLIISLAVFGISKCAPGDPVEQLNSQELKVSADPAQNAEYYRRSAAKLGLDKPVFYFSLTTAAFPDSLWAIYPLSRRERLSDLIAQSGNWPAVRAYDKALNKALLLGERLPDSISIAPFFNRELVMIGNSRRLDLLQTQVVTADSFAQLLPPTQTQMLAAWAELKQSIVDLNQQRRPDLLRRPAFHWYGLNNQYQEWLGRFVTGDWGYTKQQKPVWDELKPALYASMSINGIALFWAFLIAIPLGVEMARRQGHAFDRWSKRILFFVNGMPVFWLGSLLIMLVTSRLLGKPMIANPYLDVSDGWDVAGQSFGGWFLKNLPKFSLPILVLSLHALAVIAMQMRGGVLETLQQDYIRTARAKGVREEEVYWKHAFRNSLFPIITLFGSVLPALFTGSLVIETLFNFPGLGLKTQNAFVNHDLAVLAAVLMAAATLTILGNLMADILYSLADPRVRFGKD